MARKVPSGVAAEGDVLAREDIEQIEALNGRFYDVYSKEVDSVTREEVLRDYITIKQSISGGVEHFGLVNNRIYLGSEAMLIPYILRDRILAYLTGPGSSRLLSSHAVREGLIITDDYLMRLAGFKGEVIDLEERLFEFDSRRAKSIRVARIRDMAEQLRSINLSANRNDAVYRLRILAARLSLFSFKQYLGAKNLQAEVRDLLSELTDFLNTLLSYRLPFLVRILVRNISSVVTKPKLIDRLWNDTIDLAEVEIRGSNIVNEIRRSAHHAVGKRTLTLTQAYLEYLDGGDAGNLARLGYPAPDPADVEARGRDRPKQILARILHDLEELLGSSEVVRRIREWRETYAETLIRCELGKSVHEDLKAAVSDGINERNRWIYYHHVRGIINRVAQFSMLPGGNEGPIGRLQKLLQMRPDEPEFDAESVTKELSDCVDQFVRDVRAAYQNELFVELDKSISDYDEKAYFKTFEDIFELRRALRKDLPSRAFPEQRLLLLELDCLLEEMGYVALRNIATKYEEEGVNLLQCFEIIRRCAMNLTHDGLHSRQLLDLVVILMDETKTYAELENVLAQIQRNYQHLLQRLISPFEGMRERLGLEKDEFQVSLANMQRFLHDLNTMASFTDAARSYIEEHVPDLQARVEGGTEVRDALDDTDDVIHLSHIDEVAHLVESEDSRRSVRECYGGKGSGLIYISYLRIPTPDGFILPTSFARRRVRETDDSWLDHALREHLGMLAEDISKRDGKRRSFGRPEEPILLAVRSGSVLSMPGILSTALFVGMNDEIAQALARVDPWHAYDSYRKFLASFGHTVWNADVEKYNLVDAAKEHCGVEYKYELPWEAMKEITESTKAVLREEGFGEALEEILADPIKQLFAAVRAVFNSWNCETAARYRQLKGIRDTWQTAAVVQEMVCGNHLNPQVGVGMDETQVSLTGVISKSMATDFGTRACRGEFKFSAAGDDLVAGLTRSTSFMPLDDLDRLMPVLNRRLRHTVAKLRRFMGTDQEIEFTVDRGVLSILQCRAAEIGANKEEYQFMGAGEETAWGIGVRGTAFRGLAAFDEDDLRGLRAEKPSRGSDYDGVLLILENPSPGDIPVVLQADGLLSSRGGSTSHVAVAANGIDYRDFTAVMGAHALRVNALEHEAMIVDENGSQRERIRRGDVVSIHGSTGAVYIGSREVDRV